MVKIAFALLIAFQQPNELKVISLLQKCTEDGRTCTYTGNVIVTYQDLRIEAETVTVNFDTHEATAAEHAKLTHGDEQLDGENLSVDYQTKAATMQNVS